MGDKKRGGEYVLVRPDLRAGASGRGESRAIREAAETLAERLLGDAWSSRKAASGGGRGPEVKTARISAGFYAWKASSEAVYARESLATLKRRLAQAERAVRMVRADLGGAGAGRARMLRVRLERWERRRAKLAGSVAPAREAAERAREAYERAAEISKGQPRGDAGAARAAGAEFRRAWDAAEEAGRLAGERSREMRPPRRGARRRRRRR
jgi:hypothetical protein